MKTEIKYTREEIESARLEILGDIILQEAGLDRWGYCTSRPERSLSYASKFIEEDRGRVA